MVGKRNAVELLTEFHPHMAKVSFEYDDRNLRRGIKTLPRRLDNAVSAVTDRKALWSIGWLRGNAPWTDDTGAARSGLFAIANNTATYHEIFMAYSVTYGIWLEIANNGRYAVITPGMRIIGSSLMQDLQYLLDRLETVR